MNGKQAYVKNLQEELERGDTRIAEMIEAAKRKGQRIESSLHNDLESLRSRIGNARRDAQRLYELNDTAWDEAVQGLNEALGEIRKAFDNLAAPAGKT